MSIPVGLQDPAAARDTNRLPLRRTGVYPLEIELRDASERGVEGDAVRHARSGGGARQQRRTADREEAAGRLDLAAGRATVAAARRQSRPEGARGLATHGPDRSPGRGTRQRRRRPRHAGPEPRDPRGVGGPRPREQRLRLRRPDPAVSARHRRDRRGLLRPDRHGLAPRPRPERRRRRRADPRRGRAERLLRRTYQHRHRVRAPGRRIHGRRACAPATSTAWSSTNPRSSRRAGRNGSHARRRSSCRRRRRSSSRTRSTCSPPTTGSSASSRATRRRRCARHASSPACRWSRSSSPTCRGRSRSPTPTTSTRTRRCSTPSSPV